MTRSIGALVVLGLIGGAIWIGLASSGWEEQAQGHGLECPPDDVVHTVESDFGPNARGFWGAPEDAVRHHLIGLQTEDEVQIMESEEARVSRDGSMVGNAHVAMSSRGGWLVTSSSMCASTGIILRGSGDLPDIPFQYRGTWVLVSGSGSAGVVPSSEDDRPYLSIEPRKVNGSTGCNSLAGPVHITDTTFDARGTGHTEIGCPGVLGEVEVTFFTALQEVDTVERVDNELRLTGNDAELVFRFVPPPPSVPLIGTRWHIEGLYWVSNTVQSAHGGWFELRDDHRFVADTGCRKVSARWSAEGDAIHISRFDMLGDCNGDVQQDRFLIDVFRDGFTAEVHSRQIDVYKLGSKKGVFGNAPPFSDR